MANTNPSPNMSMPVPTVGIDPGPDWADNINACLTIVDQHDHSSGNGVPINPAGLNINADLPFNNNNATALRSSRFQSQSAPLALVTDLNCAYVSGVDLYFNDGNGNQIRVTQSGAVAGTPGSIANLVSPASASYVSANQTFVWQSAALTPANLDAGFIILRNNTASSKGLTLSPPAAMGANYSITLPSLPGATNLMTLDSSGNMGAAVNVDNFTLQLSANILAVKDGGITSAKMASNVNLPGSACKMDGQPIIVQMSNAVGNLAIVRGAVGALGNAPIGEGFTPSGSGGSYKVDFTTTFSGLPSVVASVADFSGGSTTPRALRVYSIGLTSFRVTISDTSGNLVPEAFTFIAIGPR